MPVYEYRNENGVTERVCSFADAPKYVMIGGRRAYRQLGGFAQAKQWSTGLVSEAAAIHPRQVPRAMEIDKAMGVPTRYDKWGRPTFESRGHRKRYLKAHGLHDQSGGYGD